MTKPTKTVPVTLLIRTSVEVDADDDDHDVQFFVEEHHCLHNYPDVAESEKEGYCTICSHADAVVGHFTATNLTERARCIAIVATLRDMQTDEPRRRALEQAMGLMALEDCTNG